MLRAWQLQVERFSIGRTSNIARSNGSERGYSTCFKYASRIFDNCFRFIVFNKRTSMIIIILNSKDFQIVREDKLDEQTTRWNAR